MVEIDGTMIIDDIIQFNNKEGFILRIYGLTKNQIKEIKTSKSVDIFLYTNKVHVDIKS